MKIAQDDMDRATALADARQREYAELVAARWRVGLTHQDWYLDGRPIRSKDDIAFFNQLQWDRAWLDLGPSIAGNPGPYWHVPAIDGDTVHRLYPKVLGTKWGWLILHACFQAQAKSASHNQTKGNGT